MHGNIKDNNLERDTSQAGSLQSIDSGIDTVRLSSTYKSSVADNPYLVGDDKDRVSQGVSREEPATCQQLEDMKALVSRFSNFESVILDQLKKGIERLQESQDELKKSVTAEMSQLRKQVKELEDTVTALQLSLVSLPNIPNFIFSII